MRIHKKTQSHSEVKVGSILMAQPFWADENYKRAVILILEHNSNGSAGIIINKPSTISIHDALPELNIVYPLYFGGPSEVKTVSYIHNNGRVPDTIPLGNELFWGGDYDSVVEMASSNKLDVRQIKFCAGFVHWNPGQLEEEIDGNKWWLDEINPQEVFMIPPDDLWAIKLLNNGHLYGLLNNIPDPALN